MPVVAPALISPRRAVPAHVVRPEYVDAPAPQRFTGEEVKDADQLALLNMLNSSTRTVRAAADYER